VTNANNPQQGGEKGKCKNKDLSVLVDERLTKIKNSMTTLTDRVYDMDKLLEELKSIGDFE